MHGRPFERGNKMGKGRPPGSRNQRTVFSEMMESHGEPLIKQCLVRALKGDSTAMRLCMERLLPPCKPSNNRFRMPVVKTASDVRLALQSVLQEVARGRLSAQEGGAVAAILETHRVAIETDEFGERLKALEQQMEIQRKERKLDYTPKIRHEAKEPNTLNGEVSGIDPEKVQPRSEERDDEEDFDEGD